MGETQRGKVGDLKISSRTKEKVRGGDILPGEEKSKGGGYALRGGSGELQPCGGCSKKV